MVQDVLAINRTFQRGFAVILSIGLGKQILKTGSVGSNDFTLSAFWHRLSEGLRFASKADNTRHPHWHKPHDSPLQKAENFQALLGTHRHPPSQVW